MNSYLLCVCVGVVFIYTVNAEETIPGHVLLAQTVWKQLLPRFERQLRTIRLDNGAHPLATLLPPNIPDPDCFGPGFIPINITIPDPLIKLYGEVGVTSETKAYGFSKIQDNFQLTYIALTGALIVSWDFGIPNIALEGDYRMNITIDLGSTMGIFGEGPLTGTVDAVFLNLLANGRAPAIGKMSFQQVEIDLGFFNFSLNGGEEATVGGVPINWDRFSSNLQLYFDTIWNDETRPLINNMLTCSLDNVVKNCNVVELASGITECLNFDLNPDCFAANSNASPLSVMSIGHINELSSFLAPSVVCQAIDVSSSTSAAPDTTTVLLSTTTDKNGAENIQFTFKYLLFSLFTILTMSIWFPIF